jgi:hypothetical protein
MPLQSHTRTVDRSHIPLGLFCLVFGAGALWIARDYETGSVVSMGPGFFPKTVAGIIIFLGAFILIARGRDLAEDIDPEQSTFAIVPFLRITGCVLGSIVVFGLTLNPLGLPISAFLMVLLASLARRDTPILPVLATAIVLSVLSTLLFAYLLQLQIPVLPEVLR